MGGVEREATIHTPGSGIFTSERNPEGPVSGHAWWPVRAESKDRFELHLGDKVNMTLFPHNSISQKILLEVHKQKETKRGKQTAA